MEGPTLLSGCEWSLMMEVSLAVDRMTRELSQVPHTTSRLAWVGEELWKYEVWTPVTITSAEPTTTIFSGSLSMACSCENSRSGVPGVPIKSQSELERGMRALRKVMYIQKKGLVVLSRGGVIDSQRRADPMRIRNEVNILSVCLDHGPHGSLLCGVWHGLYVNTISSIVRLGGNHRKTYAAKCTHVYIYAYENISYRYINIHVHVLAKPYVPCIYIHTYITSLDSLLVQNQHNIIYIHVWYIIYLCANACIGKYVTLEKYVVYWYVCFCYRWVKHIDGLDRRLSCLFVAKHQIHPVMEVLRYKITLQSLQRTHHHSTHVLMTTIHLLGGAHTCTCTCMLHITVCKVGWSIAYTCI